MECKFCRSELPEDAKVCPNCGTPVDPQPTQENEQGQDSMGNYGLPQKPIDSTPYIIFAIISTVLCCMPLGIAAIIYASRINMLQRTGDYEGAKDAAKKSKIIMIIGAVLTLIISMAVIVMGVVSMNVENSTAPLAPVGRIQSSDDSDDMEEDTEEDAEDKKEELKEVPAEVNPELGDTWETYKVQMNDTVLTFPCEIAELEEAGVKLDKEYMPEDCVVDAGEYELAYFEDAAGDTVLIDLVNTTDEPLRITECVAGGITVDEYGLENGGLTVFFPGGIRLGMAKEDILKIYGETDDVYEGSALHMYTWYSSDYKGWCEIDLNADTGLVTSMTMKNY